MLCICNTIRFVIKQFHTSVYYCIPFLNRFIQNKETKNQLPTAIVAIAIAAGSHSRTVDTYEPYDGTIENLVHNFQQLIDTQSEHIHLLIN